MTQYLQLKKSFRQIKNKINITYIKYSETIGFFDDRLNKELNTLGS